jgi:hypothetical protein
MSSTKLVFSFIEITIEITNTSFSMPITLMPVRICRIAFVVDIQRNVDWVCVGPAKSSGCGLSESWSKQKSIEKHKKSHRKANRDGQFIQMRGGRGYCCMIQDLPKRQTRIRKHQALYTREYVPKAFIDISIMVHHASKSFRLMGGKGYATGIRSPFTFRVTNGTICDFLKLT